VNIEGDEETPAKYKVRGLPTLVYLNSEDKEMARHTGKISIQEILNTINDDGL
jgi:thioredoxin-related protein